MNTINEMGQLIISCDFDIRKPIYIPGADTNSILLVKRIGNDENHNTIHVVVTHKNEGNEIIQVDAVVANKDNIKFDEYLLCNHGDVDECVQLLNLLDFEHRRMSEITVTLEHLSDTKIIDMAHTMNEVEYEGKTYTTPYIDNPIALFSYAIDFNLHIDPRFKYRLYVGRDTCTQLDIEIWDRLGEGRTEEDITLNDLKEHLVWAEDRIADYLQNLPDIINDQFVPRKG